MSNEIATNATDIEMIMRQTDYDETTAREKLAVHKDVMQVIRDYLKDDKINNISPVKLSTHQQIYKEIRRMMDDAAKMYLEKRDNAAQS